MVANNTVRIKTDKSKKIEEPLDVFTAAVAHADKFTTKVISLLADSLSKADDPTEWAYACYGAVSNVQRGFYTHRIPDFLAGIQGKIPVKNDLAFLIRAAYRQGIVLWPTIIGGTPDGSDFC